ncbi:large subunit ribosomal protein L14e [Angomonas deanei]|nr:large subunit ribosomal protein L14e [Angomonas deanei]EPY40680.1 large subunit ribosomal protein L14e [Angomonas deanei]CAD2218710.1 Ribosomal protein L14, putative [Angomonas deanei]|eukprot:EPY38233.1 large subunit ribosomal protein L14e [Angomonas deanei]
MWRHVQSIRNVEPLKFRVTIPRNPRTKALKEAIDTSKALDKYGATRTAKRIVAKQALAASSDFERYQLRVARRSRAHWTRKIFDENDVKTPVSWHKVALKRIQKKAKKLDSTDAAKKRITKAKNAAKKTKK